jgi:hypothetical protein
MGSRRFAAVVTNTLLSIILSKAGFCTLKTLRGTLSSNRAFEIMKLSKMSEQSWVVRMTWVNFFVHFCISTGGGCLIAALTIPSCPMEPRGIRLRNCGPQIDECVPSEGPGGPAQMGMHSEPVVTICQPSNFLPSVVHMKINSNDITCLYKFTDCRVEGNAGRMFDRRLWLQRFLYRLYGSD